MDSKGGATLSLLTKAVYATDKKGNTSEIVYFINNISQDDYFKLIKDMDIFEFSIITDNEFRNKLPFRP